MAEELGLDERKRRVARIYNLASPGYDRASLRFFLACARRMVELAEVRPGEKVLDIGCGTGAAALAAAEAVGAGGCAIGVDLAEEMMARAREKARERGLANVAFHPADAEHLPFASGSFDAVVSAASMFFLSDPAEGLHEWRRVLRPGGRLAFYVFGEAAFQPMSDLFEARLRRYGVSFPVPRRPFSWQRFTDPERCRAHAAAAGFEEISLREEPFGYLLASEEEWWEVVWNSGFRGPASQVAPELLERFRSEHLAEVKAAFPPGAIRLEIAPIFMLARNPA
jgi:ubiquinone/menaquinone biosynthesis C-methylase UbiE